MESEEKKVSIPMVVGGVAIIVVVAAGGIFISLNQNANNNSTGSTTSGQQLESIPGKTDTIGNESETTATTTTGGTTSTTTAYKDGTYTASGSYTSPAGSESVDVSLTIANDTVTSVTVTPKATDSESQRYQSKFASGIAGVVVGKKIDALSVTKVNGSSLTGGGFNKAVATIKTQAKVS